MPHQVALTVRGPLRPGNEVEGALDTLQGVLSPGKGDFAALGSVHFARVFLLPGDDTLAVGPTLVYMADVDAPVEAHLRRLAELDDGALATVLACWAGYAEGDLAARVSWLCAHRVPAAATYVHQIGRDLDRVLAEAELRREISDYLDGQGWEDHTDVEVHRAVRGFVASRPDLTWALDAPAGTELLFRLRESTHAVGVLALALLALPVITPLLPAWALAIALREARDVPETEPADPAAVARLLAIEDQAVQNPFTAAGTIKQGMVRAVTMRTVLLGLDWACRHLYGHEDLAGVRSIHFARWVPVDDGRRMIFASSYDGSQESYMDDFIDRLAWGINAVFSNGEGFPATRLLVGGGARDEQAFKNYLRRHQLPSVWYSAYPTLSARNIDDDTRLRDGLRRDLGTRAAQEWLARI